MWTRGRWQSVSSMTGSRIPHMPPKSQERKAYSERDEMSRKTVVAVEARDQIGHEMQKFKNTYLQRRSQSFLIYL